jgi:putative transposase
MECVSEAFGKYGRPEIFNTDQGPQYTSFDFTGLFEAKDGNGNLLTRLSMDSKGRAFDNIYIERFWKTIKYEDIYLKGYETMKECRAGVAAFIDKYNDRREHSSLDGHTPSDVYFRRVTLRNVA